MEREREEEQERETTDESRQARQAQACSLTKLRLQMHAFKGQAMICRNTQRETGVARLIRDEH